MNTNITCIKSSKIPVKEMKVTAHIKLWGDMIDHTRHYIQDYLQEEYFQESSNLLHLEDTMVHSLDIQIKNH